MKKSEIFVCILYLALYKGEVESFLAIDMALKMGDKYFEYR
jgi:hypothetical protein